MSVAGPLMHAVSQTSFMKIDWAKSRGQQIGPVFFNTVLCGITQVYISREKTLAYVFCIVEGVSLFYFYMNLKNSDF